MTLVYSCDPLFPVAFCDRETNLKIAKQRKEVATSNYLSNENMSRIQHDFKPGDLIYLKNPTPLKQEARYLGPFSLVSVNPRNNTAVVQKGSHQETVNFRRLKPLRKG